jgi:uncharacterized membrane protein YphA (DoxX/SURF4 family)
MFPAGWPGVALLLLRITVGAASLVEGFWYLSGGHKSSTATVFCCILFILGGIFLVIGFLSPLGSALAGIAGLGNAFFWIATSSNLFNSKFAFLQMIVMAAAIMLLGPGAFSIDAYLFGRREIVIPPSRHTEKH